MAGQVSRSSGTRSRRHLDKHGRRDRNPVLDQTWHPRAGRRDRSSGPDARAGHDPRSSTADDRRSHGGATEVAPVPVVRRCRLPAARPSGTPPGTSNGPGGAPPIRPGSSGVRREHLPQHPLIRLPERQLSPPRTERALLICLNAAAETNQGSASCRCAVRACACGIPVTCGHQARDSFKLVGGDLRPGRPSGVVASDSRAGGSAP
jgi:hypothetical protein